jgi:hypothetical protein
LKKRTRTITETREVWVVRRVPLPWAGGRPPNSCAACGAPAVMITPEEAAALARVSTRTVYRWVEAGLVHIEESADGPLFVCLSSLSLPHAQADK